MQRKTRIEISTVMPVDVQVDAALGVALALPTHRFEEALAAVRAEIDDARLSADLCVRLCGDEESRQLNQQYRGQDKPTNVLSFPVSAEFAGMPGIALLGDLAICWPRVQQEAVAQSKPVEHHLTHLFVHGVLHLLGYDHVETIAAQTMEALEIRILERLHIADPYTLD